jgi:hypothetical protein
MTHDDLMLYLDMLEKRKLQFIGQEEELSIINSMADVAIYKYYNQESL